MVKRLIRKKRIGVDRVNGISFVLIMMSIIILVFSLNLSFVIAEQDSFEVDSLLFRLTIKQGELVTKTLKITGKGDGEINLAKNNLDFVSFSENKFNLSNEVIVNFNVKDKEHGIYIGEIVISNKEIVIIPMILEIESQEVLFDGSISVPPEYGDFYVGGDVVIENKIVNLERIGSKIVEIDYFLKDFKGKEIYSENENLPVEREILNLKTIPISEDIGEGNYVFGAIIKYGDSIGTTSYFIKISDKKLFKVFTGGNLVLWFVIILLIGLLFFIIYYLGQRDKVFIELQRQYRGELRKEYGRHKKEVSKVASLKPKARKGFLKKLFKKKQKRVKAIREIHKKRVKIVKKLKKAKKKGAVEKKLSEWKKQGYNVNEFLIKTGKVKSESKKDLKGKVGKLKKQGYKLG